MARLWRAFHPELPARAGRTLELSADESLHLRKVLRLAAGEPIAVFDGRGNEWRATIEPGGGRHVVVRLEHAVTDPVEPALEIRLFQGACKPAKLEWVIQKATEIGVASIAPLAAARAERLPRGARLTRWRRVAIEACKQSGRRVVPPVEPCDDLPAPPPSTPAWILDPAEDAPALATRLQGTAARELWLACGPEAGFAPEEIRRWTDAGWRATSLGPRILRTETAGIVAASIALHRWSDLGSAPQRGV